MWAAFMMVSFAVGFIVGACGFWFLWGQSMNEATTQVIGEELDRQREELAVMTSSFYFPILENMNGLIESLFHKLDFAPNDPVYQSIAEEVNTYSEALREVKSHFQSQYPERAEDVKSLDDPRPF